MFQIEAFSRLALLFDFLLYTAFVILVTIISCVYKIKRIKGNPHSKVLIYGVGVESELFLSTLERMPSIHCTIIGIISDLGWKRFSTISGINVIGTVSDLPAIIELHNPNVILTWERVTKSEFFPIVKEIAQKYNINLSISPSVHSLINYPPSNDFITKEYSV